ncbi:hypothetical protein ACFVT1_16955 [Streptomyces sp. NPDC057963]|uniref:hypothetical protein n=1 Tax=Streptomyces sp. NPDC057963 TaxID=3346290 RepID=UPI0036E83881
MRADQQVAVIRAGCLSTVPVGAAQLAEATGFSPKNCGLVPVFAVKTGLFVTAHKQTMYLPSPKGRAVARAFKKSDEAGLGALRSSWRGQWFGRAMRERLGHGPMPREGLVAKLLLAARAKENRIPQAHILLDLLVAVGMVVPDGNGCLNWYEGPCYAHNAKSAPHAGDTAPEETEAERQPQDTLFDDRAEGDPQPHRPPPTEQEEDDCESGSESASGAGNGDGPEEARVPPPRREAAGNSQAGSGFGDDDLLSLLLPPVLLADLTRLTAEEVLALHGHLRAVATLTAKLRSRPVV